MKTKCFQRGLWASFLALFTSTFLAAAQSVPVITAFSPASGAAGTVVNIGGLNFSPTAANNVVYFGAVQAAVQAASPTNLVVTVPVGATFAPITETVGGLTAYAGKPFVPTFSGGPANFSLGSQLVLPAGGSPSGVVIADFDGDGKPDLAVDNGNSGTIEIYRNISANGTITSSSFAPPVVLPIGTGGSSPMVVADLTGDGKLDLICQDLNSNLVVVIKNLCTPGNITSNSFAPAVTFAVGNGPRGIAVQDLDGDGKPEIVSANWQDSTVSVLRNTSTPGVITSTSFAPPVAFATGTEPQDVMIADIDGDGQPDLVTVDNNYYETSPGFSVLRNISTPGKIAFESHVDYAGIQDTYCIAIGDLDGDGKPDVVIGSQGGNGPDGNSISIYRNTSTPGSITSSSFAPAVNIPAGGWVNSVALGDLNGDGKLDIAAAMQIPSQLAVFLNTSTPGSLSYNSFSAPQVFASGYNANGIAIGDLNGDGVPDIAFANSYDGTFSIYQNLTSSSGSGGIPPYITAQTGDQTVASGNSATFSVTAGGTAPLSYQWFFDGTNVVGTNATLTLDGVSSADAGVYQVFIENAYGSTNSVPATLTVNSSSPPAAPYIIAQPTNETVMPGGTATFSVTAGGAAPLSYEWFFNGTNLVGTNATLILDDASPADVGSYQAFISNAYGSTNSVSATLTVKITTSSCDPAPSGIVAWWPAEGNADDIIGTNNGIVTNGSVGYAPAEVGLGFNFDGGPNRLVVPDSPSLDMGSNVDFTIEGWIRAFPTNTPQGVMSILDKRFLPVSFQCQGYEISLTYGQLNLRMSDDPSGNGDNWIAGPNLLDGQLHHIAVSVARDSTTGGNFYVDGTNVLQFDPTSEEGDLTTSEPLRIGNHPDPTYTAFFDGQIDELSIYKRALSSGEIAGIYQAGSAGKCRPLLAPMAPYITAQPINQMVVAGSMAIFSVTAEGAAPMSYQWFFDGTNVVGTNATLMLNGVSSADAGTYQAVISNAYGSTNSAAVTLTVIPFLPLSPSILAQPTNETVTAGGTAVFSVTAAGDHPLSYQWFFDETNLVGTNATLTLDNVSSADAGVYQVFVSNAYGSTDSIPATLTVSSASSSCDPAPSGIVAWWPGEGNANDIIGTNNGIVTDGTVGYAPAEVGLGFSFDGGPNRLIVPDSPSLDMGSNVDFTIEGWIRAFPTNTPQGVMSILDKRYLPVSFQCQGYEISLTYGQLNLRMSDDPSGNGDNWIAGPNLLDGQLHHIAVSVARDSTTGGNFYIDGTNVLQFDPTSEEGDLTTSEPLRIGNHPDPTYTAFFDGQIDELSIYKRALSSSEIAGIYQAGSAGKCPPAPTPGNSNIPAISSFSPAIGAAGTAVNISGLNFSPVASNNIVYFGAVQAPVESASATSLQVKVPAGATYAPITETVNGLTAYANAPFVPTFTTTPTNFSLGPQLVMTASNMAWFVVIADLDGDGKPDLAVNNGNSHTINIYRNISAGGTITSNSFAPPVVLPIGTGGQNVMIAADLTGDGKLDLLCLDENSNLVMVLKNMCTPGNINFAPAVTFAVGTDPRGVAVQDLDGDGKPEVVVANCGDSTVSVLRNLSTPGMINSSSFAPPVVFATGTRPQDVMIADIDGDGQPDLVTVNNNYYENSPSMSVLRNISTPGNIAFESNVDFAGIQDTYCIAIGDLDGDGKPDVVIGSQGGHGPDGNSISIYRNVSTPGSITTNSFAPPVNIPAGGWVNSVALGDLNGDGKLDIAAAMQIPSQLAVFLNTSSPGSISNNSFSAPQVFASGYNANGIAIGDLNGDGMSDIALANSYDGTISIYQNLIAQGGGPIIATQTVDHFSWNPIPSPQVRATRFTITITAQDAHNDIVTNFTGQVRITATNNMPVIPPVSGPFVHGSWTGMAMVPLPATNLVLRATDVPGHKGISNPFNVIIQPVLIGAPFANGMQIAWPVSASGFVLEMSTNLASGNWVVVPGQPLQSSNMCMLPVTPAITNSAVFYRLQYIGQ